MDVTKVYKFPWCRLSLGELTFNANQILSGSEVLAQVTNNLGSPVTGFAIHPEWFVTI